jgi:uncharacterized membrane protein
MEGWFAYMSAGAALVLSHVALSAPSARGWLRQRMGATGFMTLHSVASTLALVAFVLAYLAADPGPQLLVPSNAARWTVVLLMPFVVFGALARLTTKARNGDVLLPPAGIFRITRAPGSLAILLWTLLHMANTGDARRLAAFALMALIALWAIVKNEMVLARSDDPLAPRWRHGTSLIPGLALARGAGTTGLWKEIGWWRPAAAVAIYAALLLGHPYVIGPDPLLGLY